MPYRGEIEAVHARCEDLAAHLGVLQGEPIREWRGATMKDALDLEARLRARLVVLQACSLHAVALPFQSEPLSQLGAGEGRRSQLRNALRRLDQSGSKTEASSPQLHAAPRWVVALTACVVVLELCVILACVVGTVRFFALGH
jgi:hypothetical protein